MTQNLSSEIISKIFSSEFFANTDTAALVQQYDISGDLRAAIMTGELVVPPIVQEGPAISNIPAEGILINRPGHYYFTNDIEWTPLNQRPAICIHSAGVTLDLEGYTLKVNVTDTTQNYTGIQVQDSLAVTLQNGTIKNITKYGISATAVGDLHISSIIIDSQAYYNTTTKNVTPCGIFIDKAIGTTVQNCTVQNATVTAASYAGIQIIESFKGSVSGCALNNLVNNDGAVQGFSYLLSSDIKTSDCSASAFQSHYQGLTNTTGHTVLGYIPIFCIALKYDNCTSTGMTGCCDDCHGMSLFLDAFIEVNNFTAKDVTDGITPRNTGAKATGLEVYGIGITLNNCVVDNIKAIVPQDLQSTGFSACGMSITFNNCTASNVIVTDAQHNPDTAYGYGAGFGWAPDPRVPFDTWAAALVTYNNCTATNCQLGFDTWFHTNSKWENPISDGCPIFILAQPQGTERVLRMDKCSELPPGQAPTTTLKNIAAHNTFPQVEPIASTAEKAATA